MHLAQDIDLRNGIIGGIIIGISSTTYLLVSGRITGLSGIFEGIIIRKKGEESKFWTVFYTSGLVCAGFLNLDFLSNSFGNQSLVMSPYVVCAAGLLTGFGTRLGSGCTSGHGVCGLPRLSLRSLAAVLTFMTTGALSASLSRSSMISKLIYSSTSSKFLHQKNPLSKQFMLLCITSLPTIFSVLATTVLYAIKNGELTRSDSIRLPSYREMVSHAASFGCALLFGIGLRVSGMCNTDRVHRFLDFLGPSGWDPTLMGVMGGGVLFNLITFNAASSMNVKPPLSQTSSDLGKIVKIGNVPENLLIDWKLLLGAGIFGVGWGLGGVCPGPALVSLGGSVEAASQFIPAMISGMVLQDLLLSRGTSSASSTTKRD